MICLLSKHSQPRFPLGRVVITHGASETFSDKEVMQALSRHQRGDWGDLCEEDRQTNDKSLQVGGRLFSAYLYHGKKVWIITEADRSATTILLPDEY